VTCEPVAAAHGLPAENLLAPDAVRRLSWEPPDPATAAAVAAVLADYGARPWQAELTAGPLAQALVDAGRTALAAELPAPEVGSMPGETA